MDILYSARESVTEIGEKEKMKNKALATLLLLMLLMLLISSFGIALNFVPAKAQEDYVIMTIAYAPSGMAPPPELVPDVGPHSYPKGSQINISAPTVVTGTVAGVQYVFLNWMTTYTESGNFYGNNSANSFLTMALNDNYTYTACYKVQYLFTVITPYDTAYIYDPSFGWRPESSRWFDAGTVGVRGGLNKYQITIEASHRVTHTGWSGDASGAGGSDSDPLNMTRAKTAVADWVHEYFLWTGSSYYPWDGGTPYNPDKQNWYPYCTYVNLTAPTIDQENYHHYLWRFDHWEIKGWNYTTSSWYLLYEEFTENITVHMDATKYCVVYFHLQYYLTVKDNLPSIDTGVENQSGYYDYCSDVTLYIPPEMDFFDLGGGNAYGFYDWWIPGLIWTRNETVTIHIKNEYTAIAEYKPMYKLNLFSSPPEAPDEPDFLYPDSSLSDWYWLGSSVSMKALPNVPITTTSRWHFTKWTADWLPGWEYTLTNFTVPMDRPKNFTANYDLEYFAKWDVSPAGLTFPSGWGPGSTWVKNGTSIGWWAPQFDTTTYVFHHWVVNNVEYDVGKNDLSPWFVTGKIDGTAYYVNKTKLFMDPSYHNETSHAYCNTFDVTIWASNFDANRLAPNAMDIYGFDIIIDFPANLIEVQDVYTNLADFFAPNDYFPKPNGKITINNAFGFVEVIATVKGNYTGFSGTKWIFKITFHVKYDPCYPYHEDGLIRFSYVKLVNHLDQEISPELGPYGCTYKIDTVKPLLEIRNAVDHTNLVKVDKNDPQTFFDVEVYLHNGVKVKDFLVKVGFTKAHINAVSVAIGNYLKPPYATYSWEIDNANGWVQVEVVQDPSVPLQNCSGVLFTIRFKVVKAIWYRVTGPQDLKSDITISYGRLSVICTCGPYDQKTDNTYLGSKDCHYMYNPLPGDLDYDGAVTVLDLQLILDHYRWWWPWGYDVTGDGWTDIMDLVYVALRFGNHI